MALPESSNPYRLASSFTEVRTNTVIGSPYATYSIGWSCLDYVGDGCALEKFVISDSPGFLTVGAEISLGTKDKAPSIRRQNGYFDSLNSL